MLHAGVRRPLVAVVGDANLDAGRSTDDDIKRQRAWEVLLLRSFRYLVVDLWIHCVFICIGD